MNTKNIKDIIYVLTEPFRVWWPIFINNAPVYSAKGAKNIKERFYYWIISLAILPFGLVISFVYLVEAAKYIWQLFGRFL